MNTKAIYGIAAGIVMVAGFMVFQPLQQAEAVHLSILGGTSQLRGLSLSKDPAVAPGTAYTLTCDAPFQLSVVIIDNTADPTGGVDNTYGSTVDWDGAGAFFQPAVITAPGALLGAVGTDTIDVPGIGFGPHDDMAAAGTYTATVIGITAEVDAVLIATTFWSSNGATCSLS